MISASEWDAYNDGAAKISDAAEDEVVRRLLAWRSENPGATAAEAREYAKGVMGEVVGSYDSVASSFAAEWYDYRAETAGARLGQAVTAAVYVPKDADEVARYQAKKLTEGDFEGFARACGEYARNDALRSLNATIMANAKRDRRKGVRFARVPTGYETCSFCLMLAGRGAVYHSRKTAGEFNHFHRRCDCKVVPSFGDDPMAELVEGRSPEASQRLLRTFEEIDARDDLTRGQKDALKRSYGTGPTLRTRDDPALEYFGPAEDDDQEALARIKEDLALSGVEIIVTARGKRENISYGPAPRFGEPGNIHVTEGMSLSAWIHEYTHFCQDRRQGFPPSIYYYSADASVRIAMEEEAYGAEIARAAKYGYTELVERLKSLLEDERRRLKDESQD